LQQQRPYLARSFQVVSDSTRRALADGAALRRTQSGAGRTGGARGAMDLVELASLGRVVGSSGLSDPRPGAQTEEMAGVGQPGDLAARTKRLAAERDSRDSVRRGHLERQHGQFAGPRIDAETPRPTPKGRGNEASNGITVPVPFVFPKWLALVNGAKVAALRGCIKRSTPYGHEAWTAATAKQLGLESSRWPRGRPWKPSAEWGNSRPLCPPPPHHSDHFQTPVRCLTVHLSHFVDTKRVEGRKPATVNSRNS